MTEQPALVRARVLRAKIRELAEDDGGDLIQAAYRIRHLADELADAEEDAGEVLRDLCVAAVAP